MQVPYQTFSIKTDERLNYFEINENDILSIVKGLNVSKACGWDKISIRTIKICGKTIAISLKLIFWSMLEEDVFQWLEKGNVLPILQRDSKKSIKSYHLLVFSLFAATFLKDLYLISFSIIS